MGCGRVSAVRPEPVHVQANDGRPSRFVWRERLYTVISVVERPEERGSASEAAADADVEPDEHARRRTEWRCWLVTASPGRNVPAVVFSLCHDPATNRWRLTRDGT
jgi:hypothetical protein